MNVRPAAVAGRFYPAAANELEASLARLMLQAAYDEIPERQLPRAMVAPHAGIIYSGAVAARAYVTLTDFANQLERVVVLGPSHYVHLTGVASCSAEAYDSPLGSVRIDQQTQHRLESQLDFVFRNDEAHRREHSLELQIPFLQTTLPNVPIVPLVVGNASQTQIVQLFEELQKEEDTLWIVSSDLSHFLSYERAREKDEATSSAIEQLQWEKLRPDDACGYFPLRGLLAYARQQGMVCQRRALKNSGDTNGGRDRVVGYGAYTFEQN